MKVLARGGLRIGTLDIETAPILAYVWDLWKPTIGVNQIHTDWSVIAFSYKWLDEKKVVHHNTGGRGPAKVRDDRQLMKLLWKFLDEADIVIAQNGISFDVKKINARFIELGMPPPSPYKVIDTKVEAQRVARFTSNRLAWLADILTDTPKDDHPEFPGFELWIQCLADNPKAWRCMQKYNDRDITSTEGVYLKLRPYIVGHPNVANYSESEAMMCPKCGSERMQKRGKALTQTGEYARYQCGSCGGWSRGRYTENSKAKRQSLLAN